MPVRPWVFALKPASWPKLLVPMVLGQTIGVAEACAFSWRAAAFGAVFTLFGLGFIVLMNDWGDARVDALKRRLFPETSPKTIPDSVLSAHRVLGAGLACGAVALCAAFLAEPWLRRPWLGAIGLGAMGVFIAYTLPPLKLNYRGGGELCETFGVGALLPWINAYAQSGTLLPAGAWALAGFASLSFASAVASGLADEASDREGGKTTVVTTLGNAAARRVSEAAVLVGAGLWLAMAALVPAAPPPWTLVPALVAALSGYRGMRAVSDRAITHAFAQQSLYKRHLHRAVWYGALLVSMAVLAPMWLS
jgi:1,4-dihydroxy-2-naphthoate octaprenyltransferase/chlorophyll synthase